MKYKIIATDFDGTLLTREKKVSEKNRIVIEKCRENGCIIVGVTARNISSVKQVCDVNMFDYLVSNNGACIYDVKNDRIDYLFSINRPVVESITNDYIGEAKGIDYCTADKYYSIKYKVPNRRYFHYEIESLSDVEGQVARINILTKDVEEIEKYKNEIAEKYYNDVYAITMADTDQAGEKKWISINPKGCNKAYTLKYLTQKINIDISDVIFFGDGQNDIEVIESVGQGVAMGNALEIVKQRANDVTLSNEENGVGIYLEKLLKKTTNSDIIAGHMM